VMLVEDETQVRDLEVRMLRQLGYTVLAAANGEQALDASRAHPGEISLLVTDVVMPNMSGKQVADALVSSRPGLRVLYLSGYTENTVVNHGVLDSNVDFLSKPFTSEALARKVREILSR
jgi:two-component system cell cycle sensor histidine kinase/response regulator CckA